MSGEPIIIIGTGLAGYSTARELRKLDSEIPLHIVSGDTGYSYSKPMLSNAIARGQEPYDLPNATAEKMADSLNAKIWTEREVTGIGPAEHVVELGGEGIRYRKLVLAVGARQMRLEFEGDAADAVMSVNDLEQYAAFREAITGQRRIAIIGAGLIGSEFANDLIAGGYEVDVVEPFSHPLGRLVPAAVGEALRKALADLGVRWHLGLTCESIERGAKGYRLTLSDGSTLEVDAILSAVGLVPRTELASAAGLATGRGIKVNRNLETSAPGIFALGDCMEVEGLLLPFVMPIMHAARALARNLTEDITALRYPVMPVVVKTPAHPIVVSPPAPDAPGRWEVESSEEGVRAVYLDAADRPLGFTLTGTRVSEKNALAREVPAVLE